MTNSDNLALPFILSSQAQKHVTHNEALLALDAIVQLSIVSKVESQGPDDAADGARYIVPENPSGNFANQSGKIAAFQDGTYQFYEPKIGWLAYISNDDSYQYYDGAEWQDLTVSTDNPEFVTIGINASADLTNRLSLSSEASLFNNNGHGHQIKINKSQPTDTASLLFQTGFSGRAEFGLAGDDQFRVKTSSDGANFNTALIADAATGHIGIGEITPSAPLTVSGHMRVEDASSGSSLNTNASAAQTDITSTANNGNLNISQTGDGMIVLNTNNVDILRLQDGVITALMPVQLDSHSIINLPDATTPGRLIYVADSALGSCMAFSDGVNWRRSDDRSIII